MRRVFLFFSPIFIMILYQIEFLFPSEKFVICISSLLILVAKIDWNKDNVTTKSINLVVFVLAFGILLFQTAIASMNFFDEGLQTRRFVWSECSIYYVTSDPHKYEEQTLTVKKLSMNGYEIYDNGMYINGKESSEDVLSRIGEKE